jgi:Protein kinase domain/Domain of unknown function (DUF4333)
MVELSVGSTLAGCRIEALLGRGGMGVVYLAVQETIGRRVALKVIAPALAADPAFRRRFEEEWRSAGALDDEHIVPVHAAGEERGVLYVIMRYVEGSDLDQVLTREGRLAPERAVDIIAQAASALDAAHAAGLIHRDVKPANILLGNKHGRADWVYLTDFGLTKRATAESSVGGLTMAGQIVGSPDYMAPERFEGRGIDTRVDVYALGCVFYRTLTGQVPFAKPTLPAKAMAHLRDTAPPPSVLAPWIPPGLDAVVARALEKDPDRRYQTAGDFVREARAALAAQPSGPVAGATQVGPAQGASPTSVAPAPVGAGYGAPTPPIPPGQPLPGVALHGAASPGGGPPGAPAPGAAWPGAAPPYGATGSAKGGGRRGLVIAIVVGAMLAIAAVVVIAVVATGGGDDTLDDATVKRDVSRFLTSRLESSTTASCPPGVDKKAGTSFSCTGRTAEGGDVRVAVRERDDSGSLTNRITSATYDNGPLVDSIRRYYRDNKRRLGYDVATLTCPVKYDAVSRRSLTCKARYTDDVKANIDVTIDGPANRFKWFEVGTAANKGSSA